MAVRELVKWVVDVDHKGATQGLGEVAGAAKRVQAEAGKTDKAFSAMGESTKKVASLLGGPFATLGDVVFELGGKASTAGSAVGALGGVAAGAVVGVAALTYAGVALAASAVEAAKRLEEQGLAAEIPKDMRDSVKDYTRNIQAMHNAVDLATVTIGSVAVEAVGNFAAALTGILSTSKDTVASVSDLVWSLQQMSTTVLDIITLGGWFEGWDGAASELNDVLQEQVDVGEQIAKTQEDIKKTYDANKDAAKDYAKELERLNKEESKRLADLRQGLLDANDAALRADALRGIGLGVTGAKVTGVNQAPAGGMASVSVTQIPTVSVITGAKVSGIDVGELTSALGGVAPIAGLGGGGLLGGIAKGLGGAAVSSAAGAGGLGALGALGPVGLGVAAVAGAPALLGTLDGAVGTLTKQFEDLPEALGHALETTLPHLLQALPDLAAAVLEAVVQLPVVLVKALPEILTGLVDTILESIKRILGFGGGERSAREIAGSRALTAIQTNDPNALRDAYEDVVRGASGKDRSRARQGLGRRAEAQRGGMPPIVINGITDPRELARRLRRELGGDYGASYATGDTL